MRLIDADALIEKIIETAQDLRTLSTKTIGEAINKTPTIDAIPIEWILNHERMPKEGKGHDAIMDMITDWRREHDTAD